MVFIDLSDFNRLEKALTERCLQYKWSAGYYFPRCPVEIGTNPIEAYFKKLKKGVIFAYSDDSPKLVIVEFERIKNDSTILVLCEREGVMCEREGFMPWLIAEIKFEDGLFIHSNLGSYFERGEADEQLSVKKLYMSHLGHRTTPF